MTRDEASVLIAALCETYGKTTSQALREAWWNAALQDCPSERVRTIFDALVSHDKWMPTPARWNEIRREVAQREHQAERPELTEPRHKPTQERITGLLAEARAVVAAARGEHDHAGGPCPVCGGHNPHPKA